MAAIVPFDAWYLWVMGLGPASCGRNSYVQLPSDASLSFKHQQPVTWVEALDVALEGTEKEPLLLVVVSDNLQLYMDFNVRSVLVHFFLSSPSGKYYPFKPFLTFYPSLLPSVNSERISRPVRPNPLSRF